MKKVLLTTTMLALTAGYAAAEVSVGGSGRMGFESNAGTDGDLQFESRIRISFSASGETDAGLSFGGSVRADNAVGGNAGTGGSVFVEGTFGKISMGDVSGAPEAAVGDLSGVGITGVGDFNEFIYLSNGLTTTLTAGAESARQAARWDYVTGDLGLHVSSDQLSGDIDTYGLAVTYSAGDISFGLGYEDTSGGGEEIDHLIGGVTAGFGDATLKVIYGTADVEASGTLAVGDLDQYGVSLDYVSGATTLTAFYRSVDADAAGDGDVFGVGVAYDLGGGASLKAGYADGDDINPASAGFGTELSDPSYDFGITMSF